MGAQAFNRMLRELITLPEPNVFYLALVEIIERKEQRIITISFREKTIKSHLSTATIRLWLLMFLSILLMLF